MAKAGIDETGRLARHQKVVLLRSLKVVLLRLQFGKKLKKLVPLNLDAYYYYAFNLRFISDKDNKEGGVNY